MMFHQNSRDELSKPSNSKPKDDPNGPEYREVDIFVVVFVLFSVVSNENLLEYVKRSHNRGTC